jgi:hypothetical protein
VVDRKGCGRWPVRVVDLVNWWGSRVKFREGFQVGRCVSIQNLQKKTHLHENKHDKRHKYVEMLNQDNDNQDERNYILRTHIEMNKIPT